MWRDLPSPVQDIIEQPDVRVKLTHVPEEAETEMFPAEDVIVTGVATQGPKALFIKSEKTGRGWEFPGGRVEDGETPQDAVEREVREETGYVVESAEPRLVLVWALPDSSVTQIVYAVSVSVKGEVMAEQEVQRVAWKEAIPEGVTYGAGGASTHELILEELAETAGRESRIGKVDVWSGKKDRVAVGVLAAGVAAAAVKKAKAKFRD